jgi:DNA-binding beta-propeller fold protein YncE
MKELKNKMRFFGFFAITLFVVSCSETEKPKEWVYQKTIKLDGINPIGIASEKDYIWLSDGDHNRLVLIDNEGLVQKTIDSLERPMHIDFQDGMLFVPEYGNDRVGLMYTQVENPKPVSHEGAPITLISPDSLDAPAAISVHKEGMAIADFYNNQIWFGKDKDWISFGHEGEHEGEFYYPTDVQITDSLIWVADAYNNRIQVFDKKGNFVKQMGKEQKMNAATGLFVSEDEVFITDFENDRALVFDHEGTLKQVLDEGIEKATDIMIKDELLHVINYRSGELVMYELQELKAQ